jgi:cbb3-type cytochrome oxidase subunit 3
MGYSCEILSFAAVVVLTVFLIIATYLLYRCQNRDNPPRNKNKAR